MLVVAALVVVSIMRRAEDGATARMDPRGRKHGAGCLRGQVSAGPRRGRRGKLRSRVPGKGLLTELVRELEGISVALKT